VSGWWSRKGERNWGKVQQQQSCLHSLFEEGFWERIGQGKRINVRQRLNSRVWLRICSGVVSWGNGLGQMVNQVSGTALVGDIVFGINTQGYENGLFPTFSGSMNE
jgi:hypothetical protein